MANLRTLIDQLCAPGEIENERALEWEILRVLGWLGLDEHQHMAGILIPHWKAPDGTAWPEPPKIIRSLDDQAAIMPEGWEWRLVQFPTLTAKQVVRAEIMNPRLPLSVGWQVAEASGKDQDEAERRARLAAILSAWLYEQGGE